jgi:tRNA modification GTPase
VFSLKIEELVRGLIELRARVEATLDFPDEEIDFLKQTDADSRLAMLRARLHDVLSASQQGSLLRDGVQVVLAGQPNVGKSSLLNRLAGEELAIVTEIPGTTRDVIRQSISVEGVPVHIIDTAGLREAREPVERIGIERTWAAIEKADLLLLLMDATQGESDADRDIRKRLPSDLPCIKVMNKIDLLTGQVEQTRQDDLSTVWLSAKTGVGLDRLRKSLLGMAGWQGGGEGLFMARERHVHALRRAQAHVESATRQGRHPELLAEELRLAQESLGTITGAFTSDDLLGEIFSRFCIGK